MKLLRSYFKVLACCGLIECLAGCDSGGPEAFAPGSHAGRRSNRDGHRPTGRLWREPATSPSATSEAAMSHRDRKPIRERLLETLDLPLLPG